MADEPSNGELQRLIERNHLEVRDDYQGILARLDQFVLEKVYNADKAALEMRLARMEREQETARNAARTALYAAVGAILSSIIAGVVLALIFGGR